jgi:hypothetical protein
VPRPIGWDTARDALESGYERTQHRRDEDLPPLPAALQRGTPGSVLSPVAVHPTEIKPSENPATPVEQIDQVLQGLDRQLVEQAREEHPEWYAQDQGW